ncbi:hypothetical protein LEN26_013525 [Aphanomyces euteiches]|nr:hypothetical protein LEN26_013525 [Aphanomyces euteiches]KAH9123893.1 hypothetical protein AeMF1_005249 [Aphanomyces euteiches]
MRATFLGLALAAVVFLAGETAAVHESPSRQVQESARSSPIHRLGGREQPSEHAASRGSKSHHSSSSQGGDGYAPAHEYGNARSSPRRSRGQTPSYGENSGRARSSRRARRQKFRFRSALRIGKSFLGFRRLNDKEETKN